jgi:hypothetical protein
MLNKNRSSSECCNKVDFCMVEKVVILALKSCVGLLLDLENNISGLDSRSLIALPSEVNLMTCTNAPIDVDVEHLSLNDCLLATAGLASVLLSDDLTLSITVGADRLETLDHRAHLTHHRLHTVTITSSALLDGTFLSTTPITFWADDGLLQGELGNLASVNIFEGDLVDMVNCASLRRATLRHTTAKHAAKSTTTECGSPTEELCEEVLGVHSTACTATF